MKNLLYPLLFATAFMATACTNTQDDVNEIIDPSGKTAISFVGQDNARLVTRAGFEKETQIVMHIRSNKKEGKDTDVRETRTLASAAIDSEKSASSTSAVSQQSAYVRYWDDAFGRDAQLSVFAIAVPGKKYDDSTLEGKLAAVSEGKTWNETALSEEVTWTVAADQSTEGTLDNEDLVYSNNIKGNDQLKFNLTDKNNPNGPGKFDQGKLQFNHALSRITVTLVKGTGFGDDSFKFADNTNIKVLGVPTTGTLNIETGTWSSTDETGISRMYTTETTTNAACTLIAQMIPGFIINQNNNTNVLEFTINNNKYFITQDMMFASLNGKDGVTVSNNSITMEKGHNYNFTITVGKAQINNVKASLEPWTKVTAEDQNIDNAHITLSLFSSTNGTACDNFDLYRLNDPSNDIDTGASSATNWGGNYTDKATLTQGNSSWSTNWFFDDNKSFYHFRTVGKDTDIKGVNDDNENKVDDYFEITSGAQNEHDYHWGAPFKANSTLAYDTSNGYTSSLSPAIGATNSAISLTELHMMSNINVVLQTTKTENAVALEVNKDSKSDQCEVTLTYFYANGQVKLGNGLVTPTGDLSASAKFTVPTAGIDETDETYKKTGVFTYAVVPQALKRTGDGNIYVGITIKTPDNNQYYVVEKLTDIVATANGGSQNQNKEGKIDFWYPNHSYTYTFTLTKAGISNVTCTVNKWVDVTAAQTEITLED